MSSSVLTLAAAFPLGFLFVASDVPVAALSAACSAINALISSAPFFAAREALVGVFFAFFESGSSVKSLATTPSVAASTSLSSESGSSFFTCLADFLAGARVRFLGVSLISRSASISSIPAFSLPITLATCMTSPFPSASGLARSAVLPSRMAGFSSGFVSTGSACAPRFRLGGMWKGGERRRRVGGKGKVYRRTGCKVMDTGARMR